MTLPTFIGIGGERCGSTWLHTLLAQHPSVYMPIRRKELKFFSHNFDKGLEWYESFFPNEQQAIIYKAIGEISPGYLTYPGCEEKIVSVKSVQKLIVILRNPVKRAYSHYGHTIRLRNYSKSFEEFLMEFPAAITMGFYAKHLEHYFQYFERKQLYCLVFEESVANVASTKKNIAHFLEIEPEEFPKEAGTNRVNETYIPKLKRLNHFLARMRNRLRQSDLDWAVNLAKAAGFQKMLQAGSKPLPPMSMEMQLRLQDIYRQDIEKLEKLLDINLDVWRV